MSCPPPNSILLADHRALRRQGLRALLAAQGEFEITDEADDATQALNKAIARPPGLMLIDAALPDGGGFQAAAQIRRRLPGTRIIMLTQSKTTDCAPDARLARADAYVLHDATFDELLSALRSVARGKRCVGSGVAQMPAIDDRTPLTQAPDSTHSAAKLTARELGILQLVAEGRTNRGAAEFLGISPKTVEQHRASLMRKFGLRNAGQLLLAAINMGLVERPVPGGPQVPALARGTHSRSS